MLPDPIKKFVEMFAGLPGIGPRQATRLAFHIKTLGQAAVGELAKTVYGLNDVKTCPQCFFTHTGSSLTCYICSDSKRDIGVIAIVEKETDLISLEKTKKFGGRYLVLGELKKAGALDSAQKLKLKTLKNASEIILAINPTTYGDITAEMIAQELKGVAPKITRLGRGIPTGGEIEFADEDTLGGALDNRK
ncbi:MAG: toprim domain-containing protein [Patescibacteria group bacterium]